MRARGPPGVRGPGPGCGPAPGTVRCGLPGHPRPLRLGRLPAGAAGDAGDCLHRVGGVRLGPGDEPGQVQGRAAAAQPAHRPGLRHPGRRRGDKSVLDHHGSFGFPVVVSAAGAGHRPGRLAGQRRAGAGGRGGGGVSLRRRGPGRAAGGRAGGHGGGAGRHAAGRPGSRVAGGAAGRPAARSRRRPGPQRRAPRWTRREAEGPLRRRPLPFAAAHRPAELRGAGRGGRGAGRADRQRPPERGGARRGRVAGARPGIRRSPASPPAPGWASRT